MKETLAVKYRPITFDEVIGQEYIKEILTNQVESGNIGKAYLYTGVSGIGKTTIARIFAQLIDAEVIEIDAASNNGVENIRNINENVHYKPLVNKYKVYIIDEAHMLSKGAWNAMLKTLEEPPPHAIFILATTEAHKVPATIISRSQRFNFTRPSTDLIFENLTRIVTNESQSTNPDVLKYISKLADGGVRLSITMLESCLNVTTDLDVPMVEEILGYIPTKYFIDILKAVVESNREEIIKLVQQYHSDGMDFHRFIENLVMFVLDLQKYAVTRDMKYLRTSSLYKDDIKGIMNIIVRKFDKDISKLEQELNRISTIINRLYYESQRLEPKRYLLEVALLSLTNNPS